MSAVRRADPADAGELARLRWRFRETGNVLELALKAPCNAPEGAETRVEEAGR